MSPRTGGHPTIRVLLKAGVDVRHAFLSSEDPPAPSAELDAAVREASNGATELVIRTEDAGPIAAILGELQSAEGEGRSAESPAPSLLLEWQPDVVVLSLAADAADGADADAWLEHGRHLVTLIKERVGAHVLLFNCSSVDPRGFTSNYARQEADITLRVHQLNRAAIELSAREGISLVDADHLAAQAGARTAVLGALHYSDGFEAALGTEVVRILADYGFFEQRPLVAQMGRPPTRKVGSTA
ncbi:MAG: hypothetical protein ACLPVF_07610 [Acidimicrobiales bacterium]